MKLSPSVLQRLAGLNLTEEAMSDAILLAAALSDGNCGCYMYLFAIEECHLYKVGISECPEIRAENLSRGSPFDLKILGTWPFITREEAFYFEQWAHSCFEEFHQKGEWFRIPEEERRWLIYLDGLHWIYLCRRLENKRKAADAAYIALGRDPDLLQAMPVR